MFLKSEEKEYHELGSFFEALNKENKENQKAHIAKEKETVNTLHYSADDLKSSTFIENDYIKDEFSDLEPTPYIEHGAFLERSQVQYILIDF